MIFRDFHRAPGIMLIRVKEKLKPVLIQQSRHTKRSTPQAGTCLIRPPISSNERELSTSGFSDVFLLNHP